MQDCSGVNSSNDLIQNTTKTTMFLGGSNNRIASPIIDKAELSSIFNSANLKFLPMTPESDSKPSSANNNILSPGGGRNEKSKIGQ